MYLLLKDGEVGSEGWVDRQLLSHSLLRSLGAFEIHTFKLLFKMSDLVYPLHLKIQDRFGKERQLAEVNTWASGNQDVRLSF